MIVFGSAKISDIRDSVECTQVTFEIPTDGDGGSPVLGYEVIYTPSGETAVRKTVGERIVSISNLKESHLHSVQVRARNVYGYGDLSAPFTIETTQCSCL